VQAVSFGGGGGRFWGGVELSLDLGMVLVVT